MMPSPSLKVVSDNEDSRPARGVNSEGSPRASFVFVSPWDLRSPGGVIEVVANLFREVEDSGEFEPILLVSHWSARRPRELTVDGRRTIYFRLSSPWTGNTVWGFCKWLIASPLLFFDLWRLCRRLRVAVFNVHYPSLGCFAIAMLRAMKVYRGRLILSFHGMDLTWARESRGIEAWAWRFVLRHSDATVACSAAFGREMSQFTAGRASVAVVHNGLDIDRFLRSTASNGSAANPLDRLGGRDFILSVAKLEHRKGLDVLIRAFAELRRSDERIALAILGNPGDTAERLRALTDELALGNDVFFFDAVPHDQVGAFFERAKVVCLPSRSETFGLVLLEAGAFRRAVVATRVGGIPEVIQDGDTGLLVESEDPAALAQALSRALADDELAHALGERLFRRVETEFTWKRSYAAYRELVSAPPELGRDR